MDLSTIVVAGKADFTTLVGLGEDQTFEAKKLWPDLSTANARWEFAKDVAAMANGGGGSLVYGLATQKDPTNQTDRVASVHVIDPKDVDGSAAEGMIDQHVHPSLKGLQIVAVPGASTTPQGLVVVVVPPQPAKVMLCKVIEGTESLKEFLFGYVERDQAGTKNWTRQEVAKMLRSGTSEVSLRLEGIEQMLASLVTSAASTPGKEGVTEDELQARVKEVLTDE